MRTFLIALVFASALVPATFALDSADACQPLWWKCPLNGQMYATCGTAPPTSSPGYRCARDVLNDALPP